MVKLEFFKTSIFTLLFAAAPLTNAAPAEVVASGTLPGINAGFGDRIGAMSRLDLAADVEGVVNWTLTPAQGEIDNENAVVIYLDTDFDTGGGDAGVAGTGPLTDIGNGQDMLRAAVSGKAANGSGAADLTFAPGFKADYALAFNKDVAVLYQLKAGPAEHGYVATVSGDPFGPAGSYHFSVKLADLGLSPGATLRFVATYLDPVSAYRSNEFIGVADASVPDHNIEAKPQSLRVSDFVTFQTAAVDPAAEPE